MRTSAILMSVLLMMSVGFRSPVVPAANGQSRDTTQQVPSGSGYKVRVDVNTVFLNVSVRDRYNRSIAQLQKEDFLVYEDGVPQEVQQLVSEEAPFNTLLLLDNSGSTRPYLDLIKNAAIDFTRRMKPDDRIAVVAFNSLVDLMQDFTNDRQNLQLAIEKIESIGGTALYDSLLICINRYMRGVGGRNAIVVFTDGIDNQLEGRNSEGSHTPFDTLYRRIQEIEPIIYTIFLNTGNAPHAPPMESPERRPRGLGWPLQWPQPQKRPWPLPQEGPWPRRQEPPSERPTQSSIYETARQHLYMIAEQTGGRMYQLTSVQNLSSAYAEIADDLAARYQIAYNPTNTARDGKWRRIRVQVKGHPEAAVRTRKGYYATEW